ncbi:MAG: hypothetical protein QF704_12100, partial [Anaerolineales bacterium]|nr:hypothetical protein [Anaerolineales bacterium]
MILRNVSIWGTRKIVTSGCSGSWDTLSTNYFGRSNSFSALDNLSIYDGGNINFQSNDYSASWQINNITIHNMSGYVYHYSNQFRDRCNGGSWNGKVTMTDVNYVYLGSVAYYSTSTTTNYCHYYESSVSNWTFNRMNSVYIEFDGYYSNYPSANHPLFIQGNFTEVTNVYLNGYSYGSYDTLVRDSTFTESRVQVSPSRQSSGKMYLYNNTFVDSQIKLTAQSQASTTGLILEGSDFSSTQAPPTGGSWTDYYIDGNDYGKWIVQNNTFTPANGWKNLRYTYNIGNMRAPYNWWGSATNTTIDGNINDYLDSNGGGWVNYSPFWTSTAMTQLDWNGTSPSSVPLPNSVSGTLIFNQTMFLNNSPYYLIGPLSVAPGVRLTIEPGVEVYANTTNSSITVYGELHAEGTVASPIEFGLNPSITRNCNQGWW